MIKIVEQSLLYDFYGELLTKHQKEIYEDVVIHDYSLSEIANEKGISRQGVHDLIKRCDKTLKGYEDKLHLVERFMNTKQDVLTIRQLADEFKATSDLKLIDKISDISYKILEEI
ncbi:MAG: DNA-binding protein [Lachnospiraceae bacterium]|nr:DNA-binding protein [Lachnospiraceae bacterium]